MEIQKVKQLREQLENNILSLIQKFESETGTNVSRLYMDNAQSISEILPKTTAIQIELRF